MQSTHSRVKVRQTVTLPILGGNVTAELSTFSNLSDSREHIALRLGPATSGPTYVRVHSECLTGDVFGSQRCDCGLQLNESIFRLNCSGGLLLYLRQEGRGIGLYSKIDAYALQSGGLDTFAANRALNFEEDERDYGCAAEMLAALGVSSVRLISNNPDKARQLREFGIDVVEQLSTGVFSNDHNRGYLKSKADKAAHQAYPRVDPVRGRTVDPVSLASVP